MAGYPTLGDLAQQVTHIICFCNRCPHTGRVPLEVMVGRWGPGALFIDVRPRLRCSGCGSLDTWSRPDWQGLGVVTRHGPAAVAAGSEHREMLSVFLQEIEQPLLIVHHLTGIVYVNQCGGGLCYQQEAEGYIVPLHGPRPYGDPGPIARLIEATTGVMEMTRPKARAIDPYLGELQVFLGGLDDDRGYALRFDFDRLDLACEAFLPVEIVDTDKVGTLVWNNSD